MKDRSAGRAVGRKVGRIAYLDCPSGVAGDMLLAAFLDAGASPDAVLATLAKLPIEGWELTTETVTRSGIRGLKADVTSSPAPIRTLDEIKSMITSAGLPGSIEHLAIAVFERLAGAEARAHGAAADTTHLHEAGNDDAIIDVVGCCTALTDLRIDRLGCSPVAVGSGVVRTSHGELPVPVPAVSELLRDVPIVTGGEGELTTPTGAALVTSLCTAFGSMPPMTLRSVGWGAGTAERGFPNLLRVFVGEEILEKHADDVIAIEASIDDMTPELIADAAAALIRQGALDAWIVPVVMKKGRPGYVLHALATPELADQVRETMLRETTTFGVRSYRCTREILDREWREVSVHGHQVRVKVGRRGGDVITSSVEYDDAVAVARATGLPLKEIYRLALDSEDQKTSQA